MCVCQQTICFLIYMTWHGMVYVYGVENIFSLAKRWCVWCNLQINVKRLIIFCVFFVLFWSNSIAISVWLYQLVICNVMCCVVLCCTRCIPVSPFRLIIVVLVSTYFILTTISSNFTLEANEIIFSNWIVYKMF